MSGTKKQYNAAEKTKIALEAIKSELTIARYYSALIKSSVLVE